MKRIISVSLFLFSLLSLFGTQRSGVTAAGAVVTSTRVVPTYKNFGEIADVVGNKDIEHFTEIMKEDFSFDWTEENFDENVKRMLSSSSREISKLIPIKTIVYSSVQNARNSVSFSFSAVNEKGEEFEGAAVLENGKIMALTLININK